jgi:DNA repair protein RadD
MLCPRLLYPQSEEVERDKNGERKQLMKKRIKPRGYQVKAAEVATTSRKKRILIVSPGASGKSVMIALCVKVLRALKQKKRILIVTHRREIIEHLKRTLHILGEKPAIIMGADTTEPGDVTVASIESLLTRGLPKADVLIIDEAHRTAAASYKKLIAAFSDKRVIGFSATPYRLDGKPLDEFETMYEAITVEECIKKGWIVAPTCYNGEAAFLPEVRTSGSEYSPKQLQQMVTKDGLIGSVVRTAKKRLEKRQAVLFAVSVPHSQALTAKLNEAGIKAVHVDGAMPTEERKKNIYDFEAGKYQVICNCMLLTEGWDMPECDAVILCRPTLSLSLYLQMIYRCMRAGGRFPAIVLDHTWAVALFGLPDRDRKWSLDCGEQRQGTSTSIGVRICKSCEYINDKEDDECIQCGEDLKTEYNRVMVPWERAAFELRSVVYSKVKEIAERKGHDKQWIEAMLAKPDVAALL